MAARKIILFVLYGLLMLIISTPISMMVFGLKSPDKPLNGETHKVVIPKFSIESFNNHQFQLNLSKYLNQEVAFGAGLTRLYNQVEYSLFRNITNKNVVLGKNNYLYETWHIDTYYGKDFVGKEFIKDQIKKLDTINSILKLNNTKLIVVLAAGKPSIYPEFIPEYLKKEDTPLTNYRVYSKQLKNSKIDFIDFNSWFMDIKPNCNRNLFPKNGAHWSVDASLLVLDSLINYCDYLSDDSLNKLIIDSIIHQNQPLDPDNDISEITNLLFESTDDYYYPQFRYEKLHKPTKKIVIIGDSFFWTINQQALNSVFKKVQYWFYFKHAYQPYKKQKHIDEIDYIEEIKDADFVMLFSSPSPLNKLGWGFIDKTCRLLILNNQTPEYITKIIRDIKKNSKLYSMVKEKAHKKNISVDSMLYLEARYIHRTEFNTE